jgi:gluconolactonase
MQMLARDIRGAEGPLVTRDGRIFMVEPSQGRVLEVLGDGRTQDLVRYDGRPAGLQLDTKGDIWIADMRRGIMRATLAGELHPEITSFQGAAIRGCNDCYFDSQGHLYFTAPGGSSANNPVGEIYCRLGDGSVQRLDGEFQFCNGLAVSADDSTLIVAETQTRKLWAYDLPAPGQVQNKRLWATLPGEHRGGPDGMDYDEAGHLLVTNWGGSAIEIYDQGGQHIGRIQTPFASPSNIHFTGPGQTGLLITEHENNAIWRTQHLRSGQMQFGWM